MNRKGFTLIELLAVILILSSISIVAVISITNSLEKRDVKECEEQKQLAVNAGKIYFSLNGGDSVKVSELISGGYFNEKNKITRLNGDSTVTLTQDGYKFNGECKSS